MGRQKTEKRRAIVAQSDSLMTAANSMKRGRRKEEGRKRRGVWK
jgi:hypothetical protein